MNGKLRTVGIFQTNFSAGCSPALLLIITEILRGVRIGMETDYDWSLDSNP